MWEAANILRGPVDETDFKTYVFPLLFFKRLNETTMKNVQPSLIGSYRNNTVSAHVNR